MRLCESQAKITLTWKKATSSNGFYQISGPIFQKWKTLMLRLEKIGRKRGKGGKRRRKIQVLQRQVLVVRNIPRKFFLLCLFQLLLHLS